MNGLTEAGVIQCDEIVNEEESDEGSKPTSQGSAGGRSRRKPAAPQWVNPFLSDQDNNEASESKIEDNRTINGVCVVNSGISFADKEQD